MTRLWMLLHFFFAFSFVGSLLVAEWNGRAARATKDWAERASLLRVASMSGRMAGLVPLLLTGVFGNLAAVTLGYRMATETWMRWANGLWLAAVLVMAAWLLPAAGRLVATAKDAAQGGSAAGYDAAMRRWRIGAVLLSALYLAMLILMVYAARP